MLFGTLSIVVGRLLFPEQLSLSGLVPAFGTAVWTLGFFLAADTVFAQLFGASPGEFLAGVRVCMADGSKLTWSARQDRTTDALVDGTIGAVGLIRSLMKGHSAPYDRDWRVEFVPANAAQRFTLGLAIAASLTVLLATGVWLTVTKGLDADAHVAASKVLRYFSVPVRVVWANPTTGLAVELPKGWVVQTISHYPDIAYSVFEFEFRPADNARCYVALGTITNSTVGFLETNDTSDEAIERVFRDLMNESNVMVRRKENELEGMAKLDDIYTVDIFDSTTGARADRLGFVWFTGRKDSWVLTMPAARPFGSVDDGRSELALALMQSTRISHGR